MGCTSPFVQSNTGDSACLINSNMTAENQCEQTEHLQSINVSDKAKLDCNIQAPKVRKIISNKEHRDEETSSRKWTATKIRVIKGMLGGKCCWISTMEQKEEEKEIFYQSGCHTHLKVFGASATCSNFSRGSLRFTELQV